MRLDSHRLCGCAIIALFGICAGFTLPVSGQQISEAQVKGAYIYNFMKYVEWENEKDISELTIGLYGPDEALFEELSKGVAGSLIRKKPIRVTRIERVAEAGNVQLLVVPESENDQVENIATAISQTNTLLVTDRSPQRQSIMINFIYPEGGRISFEINKSNIVYERLKMSKNILLIGGTELDVAELYKEMESTLFGMKNRIAQQDAAISRQNAQIGAQKDEIRSNEEDLQKFELRILELNEEIERYDRDIAEREERLSDLQAHQSDLNETLEENQLNLELARRRLDERQADVDKKEAQIKDLGEEIAKNVNFLDLQEKEIKQQTQNIREQREATLKLGATVQTQKILISLICSS